MTHRIRIRWFLACALATALVCPAQRGPEAELPAGVTPAIQASIERGAAWLTQHQAQNGSWSSDGGVGTYPATMTSLAGMALLTGGSSPTRGRHYAVVRSAVAFLQKHADADSGLLAVPGLDSHSMYAHGFATLFLASVFGMEEDAVAHERLKQLLRKAVRLIESAQTPSGGWNYTPTQGFDEGSVTVTQLQALRACRMAGIVVDKKVIDRAVDYIRRCQNPDGGIRYRFGQDGESRPAITAAGVVVCYNAGVYDDNEFVERAVQFCRRHVLVGAPGDGHEYYSQLYWGQALYQRGGDEWSRHYEKLAAWLLRQQRNDGSWHGDGVGPVYGTAIALTLLQLPYAYVPVYQR